MSKENFSIDDLSENQRAIAEVIGMEAYIKLSKAFGGDDSLYVAKYDKLENIKRNKQIIDEFNGYNYQVLAEKHNLSVRMVREIIADFNRKPLKGQLSLFKDEIKN